jgi:hypothetical protein
LALRIAPRAPRMARVLPAWPGAVREHAHLRVRAHTHTHTHTHTQPHTATHTHTHTHSHTHTATHTHTHTHARARTRMLTRVQDHFFAVDGRELARCQHAVYELTRTLRPALFGEVRLARVCVDDDAGAFPATGDEVRAVCARVCFCSVCVLVWRACFLTYVSSRDSSLFQSASCAGQ